MDIANEYVNTKSKSMLKKKMQALFKEIDRQKK